LLLGREVPTVQIGANIGKMVKDILGQSDIEDNPLVSAGSAAGLACAFNAPFAGIIIAVLGITSPEMIGGGYDVISKVLANSFTLYFLIRLFIARMLLSIFSYSIGVPGGIFAPMLVLGVIFGMIYESSIQHFFQT